MEVDNPGGDAFSTEVLGEAGGPGVWLTGSYRVMRRRNSRMSDRGYLGARCPRTTDKKH